MTAEERRLAEHRSGGKNWKLWGPYVAEREWSSLRESYGSHPKYWEHFPFDHARMRAYRWHEDGIAGFCDDRQFICFAPAFWNGRDPILKQRLYGLSRDGNHGPDVKEVYYHLEATPTHSYMRYLYRYPQREFPYALLERENRRRTRHDPEYEITDTGIFDESRYWDIFVEYAKADEADILIRITAVNRGPEEASLHVLPTIWFRNTWSWHGEANRPWLAARDKGIELNHDATGGYHLWIEGANPLLFTGNETNADAVPQLATGGRYYKDAFEKCIIHGNTEAVDPGARGTKACGWVRVRVPAAGAKAVRARLSRGTRETDPLEDFEPVFEKRAAEAREFLGSFAANKPEELARVQRDALCGVLWSKQFCYFSVRDWLAGDDINEPASEDRALTYRSWGNLYCNDVFVVPDKWEYPWWYSWDLSFHMLPLALTDSDEAKKQLRTFLGYRYMSADGQIPSHTLHLTEPNPPVHAWSAWRIYDMERRRTGKPDREFLAAVSHKLLLHLARWATWLDPEHRFIYEGGFLGMDNIGIIDRREAPPAGGTLEQADATGWVAFLTLILFRTAVELLPGRPSYRDIAIQLLDHFLLIQHAINGREGLWHEADGFYFDRIRLPEGGFLPLKCFSLVGVVPLFATEALEARDEEALALIMSDIEWLARDRPYAAAPLKYFLQPGQNGRRLLSLVPPGRLCRVLERVLDPKQFLSAHGVRSLSRYHARVPAMVRHGDFEASVSYEPRETTSDIFAGNSNWRGPVWFPMNYLLVESLRKAGSYFGKSLQVDLPAGNGRSMMLEEVARNLSERLIKLFVRGADGRRAEFAGKRLFESDPAFNEYPLFHEYFDGETGTGLGACQQTGWTALVANLIEELGA